MAVKCVLKSTSGAQNEKGILYPVVVNYSRIDAEAFVDMMEENRGVKRAQILAVLSAMAEQAAQMMQAGHAVEIPYFGTLSMAMKGKGEIDNKGKAQLTDARFWKLRIKPCAELRDKLKQTDFQLLSREVLSPQTVSDELAKEVCQKLGDEMDFFTIKKFQNETGASHGLALKILTQLADEGFLNVRIFGRQKIYSVAEAKEEDTTSNQADESSENVK